MNPGKWISGHWHKLKSIEDAPYAVAIGVASGIFFGFTPLTGLKTLLAIGFAWMLGGNRIAAAIAASLHDVLLPVMPILLRWEYDLGYWALSNPHVMPPPVHLSHELHLRVWLHWSTFSRVGIPMLLGSLALSVPSSLVSFFITKAVFERRLRHRTPPAGAPSAPV